MMLSRARPSASGATPRRIDLGRLVDRCSADSTTMTPSCWPDAAYAGSISGPHATPPRRQSDDRVTLRGRRHSGAGIAIHSSSGPGPHSEPGRTAPAAGCNRKRRARRGPELPRPLDADTAARRLEQQPRHRLGQLRPHRVQAWLQVARSPSAGVARRYGPHVVRRTRAAGTPNTGPLRSRWRDDQQCRDDVVLVVAERLQRLPLSEARDDDRELRCCRTSNRVRDPLLAVFVCGSVAVSVTADARAHSSFLCQAAGDRRLGCGEGPGAAPRGRQCSQCCSNITSKCELSRRQGIDPPSR